MYTSYIYIYIYVLCGLKHIAIWKTTILIGESTLTQRIIFQFGSSEVATSLVVMNLYAWDHWSG